eukprot:CAMPEP_0168461842 /NCGR_PEP_ID=MMETSP0228-20121227/54197_1 /TAXON_ID=133427 /ORGANISM="Protoceratium reticulatum, Strain CCCM 535 (=CCMP 1889)" /LENGTH=53 /DNA_ID=CAMNT_0008477177 /DNA_START=530 /DNA_END=691 /DNA_ORIENTATION=-
MVPRELVNMPWKACGNDIFPVAAKSSRPASIVPSSLRQKNALSEFAFMFSKAM